jgi:hypothetical protein
MSRSHRREPVPAQRRNCPRLPAGQRALKVSRAGYYAWRRRPPSARCQQDLRLAVVIRVARAEPPDLPDPRVHAELHAQGFVSPVTAGARENGRG